MPKAHLASNHRVTSHDANGWQHILSWQYSSPPNTRHSHFLVTSIDRSLSGGRVSHLGESAFAPYVGFSVLMTPKLGTNMFLIRIATAISLVKDSKN